MSSDWHVEEEGVVALSVLKSVRNLVHSRLYPATDLGHDLGHDLGPGMRYFLHADTNGSHPGEVLRRRAGNHVYRHTQKLAMCYRICSFSLATITMS